MRVLLFLIFMAIGWSCANNANEGSTTAAASWLVYNGQIWTGVDCPGLSGPAADDSYCGTAMAIGSDGRILAVGLDTADLTDWLTPGTKRTDLNGQFVMPGLIEGHGHFSGLGSSLRNLNFLRSRSWEDIVQMVADRAEQTPEGQWITGRGWHQEKWAELHPQSYGGYPLHQGLSALTPDNPVMLRHASGHSLYANEAAMDMAGLTRETPDPPGGRIVRDQTGEAVGVFEERAMDIITDAYQNYLQTLQPEKRYAEWLAGVRAAEDEALRYGITSFQDAGSSFTELDRYTTLAKQDSLRIRLWAMLRHPADTLAAYPNRLNKLPILNAGDDRFTCRAIKSELDGALGSYGAWLLASYADQPGFEGQNTTTVHDVARIADMAKERNLQLCVHAIGDRANRFTLDLMESKLADREDHRWRIEHAQHLHPDDISRFAELDVIASMQGIHCTSDALFAETRLGQSRARDGAYAWRSLLDAGAVVLNGTDAPVEDLNPFESLYASVTRKRAGQDIYFFPQQSMTRLEALHSYTLANAYGAFEEELKGTLEPGKLADFVILDRNLVSCTDEAILETEVVMTVIGGEVLYEQ
ncbi:MAG: amidohydrolase [Bacteroidota bacterium]